MYFILQKFKIICRDSTIENDRAVLWNRCEIAFLFSRRAPVDGEKEIFFECARNHLPALYQLTDDPMHICCSVYPLIYPPLKRKSAPPAFCVCVFLFFSAAFRRGKGYQGGYVVFPGFFLYEQVPRIGGFRIRRFRLNPWQLRACYIPSVSAVYNPYFKCLTLNSE